MRKLLIILSAALLASGVVAAGAFACTHGAKGSDGWHSGEGGTTLVAVLTPPSGATGPTGSTAAVSSTKAKASHHDDSSATGVKGLAVAKQSSKGLKLKVGVRGLTAGATYNVSIVQDADGQGCASATNPALDPPGSQAITANDNGFAKAKLVTATSEFALDLTKKYDIKVSDTAGAIVACGELTPWTKHHHGHGSRHGHHEGH
jgi:hypothetical protein